MIRVDTHLFTHAVRVVVDGTAYLVSERYDSPLHALVPPCEGAPVSHYEERGIEVAQVTHASEDGSPLAWKPLPPWIGEEVLVKAGVAEEVT